MLMSDQSRDHDRQTEHPATPSSEQAELFDLLQCRPDGTLPAIAQSRATGEVLMLAWMNRASIAETLATGRVCYWSRSRQQLWRKGESSGQIQQLVEMRIDCDGDTLLLIVDQTGVACHTGRRSCFYRTVRDGRIETILPVAVDPAELYGRST